MFVHVLIIVYNIREVLKGPSQPHLCFCLYARVSEHVEMNEITVKLLKITKHTFRNTTYSKAIRFHFTMQYQ